MAIHRRESAAMDCRATLAMTKVNDWHVCNFLLPYIPDLTTLNSPIYVDRLPIARYHRATTNVPAPTLFTALVNIAGDQFKLGVILYDGTEILPLGVRLWAAPISTLWGQ